jgi:hypothetical protein
MKSLATLAMSQPGICFSLSRAVLVHPTGNFDWKESQMFKLPLPLVESRTQLLASIFSELIQLKLQLTCCIN